jgi:hypothetical protein
MVAPRTLQQIVLACALTAVMAACGSSNSSSSTGASSSPATPAAPATSASPSTAASGSAESTIAANWTTFFNAKTPNAQRVALLQDGQVFASVLKAQSGSSLASSASAKVTKVTLVSATQAKVTYSILIGGQPALSNQTGTAVLQGGTWKVGLASFCGLLTLENSGKTSGLPSVCRSAG